MILSRSNGLTTVLLAAPANAPAMKADLGGNEMSRKLREEELEEVGLRDQDKTGEGDMLGVGWREGRECGARSGGVGGSIISNPWAGLSAVRNGLVRVRYGAMR